MPFVPSASGEFVTLSGDDGSSITVYRQGAHVASWKNSAGRDFMYVSPTNVFKKGTPIRGGVPLIWPQFSDMGPLPAHGVARVRDWDLVEERPGFASFGLSVRPGDAQLGSIHANLLLKVHFSNTSLNVTLDVVNKSEDTPLPFKFAFHTYFAVSNVRNIQIFGLDEASFADNLQQRKIFPPAPIREITQETDRIYYAVKNPVTVTDAGHGTSYVIAGENLADVVLWNPWVERAKKIADLPDDGFNYYVCVENAAVGNDVIVPPSGTWSGSQHVQVNANTSKI